MSAQTTPAGASLLVRAVRRIEAVSFRNRAAILVTLLLFTLAMGWFAAQLRMEAGFDKQMPVGHEYIETFQAYRNDVLGANRLNIVVKVRKGNIWNAAALKRLYEVTQAVTLLPNIERLGVQSLWTPNSFVNEITEEGFRADPLIDGSITPEELQPDTVAGIRRAAAQGGFIGTLVSRDETSAMITAELIEYDAQGAKLDYIDYNHLLEERIRSKFEDADFEIQIIGFAKQIGDIADGAQSVLKFCVVALLLTAVAVYWYCHSLRFTLLPVVCSLTSLVWQFGTLRLLGFGLDPLAVLVPFLVFAIGVSHGVQQINYIVRRISHGESTFDACRASFSGLLIPGTLALVTAFISFITLLLIPIPMVRELAIAASLGVAYKIVTNLVMLPVAASYFDVSKAYADKALMQRERRSAWLRGLARLAEPRHALVVLAVTGAVFATAAWQSRDRVVGTLQPGAPELREDARFNRDAVAISSNFDTGLDWLTVVFEAPPESCENVNIGLYQDRFTWAMQPVEGVLSVASYSGQLRLYNEGYNEGNPKMNAVPIDVGNYAGLSAEIVRIRGTMRKDCSMTAVNLFLTDHKATTIQRVIDAVKDFRAKNSLPDVRIRLASGNAGVLAAIDDEVEKSELPMMLYVYAAIVILVFLVYRDLRAVVACCLPLTVGTFIGYLTTFWGWTSDTLIEFTRRLAKFVPEGLDHFAFTNGGSESTELAFQLARHYWKKNGRPNKHKVISLTNSYHGTSFGASSATGVFENSAAVGKYAMERLQRDFLPLPCVGEVSGLGLMMGIEIVEDKAARKGFDPASGTMLRIRDLAFERGLQIRVTDEGWAPSNRISFGPPLISTRQQVDQMLDILYAVIREVCMGVTK